MNDLICEDFFTDYVINNEGLTITRKHINNEGFDYKKQNPLVCLTGYPKIIKMFFKELIDKFENPVTIIIIESDVISLEPIWLDNKLVKCCYTWNKSMNHEKLHCLPIGLNYSRHFDSMMDWLNNHKDKAKDVSKKLLSVNYSPHTNSVRGQLVEKAKNDWSEFCDVLDFIPFKNSFWKKSYIEGKIKVDISNPECYDQMSKYKFILSPPGAGEDTHRTWEALYVGCIPIVKSSLLNSLYEDLPVVIVDDWDVITKEFLEEEYKKIQEKKTKGEYKFEKLEMSYWLNKISPPVIHFITYGNIVYQKAKKRLAEEANDFKRFKTIEISGPERLPPKFSKHFKKILDLPRVAGYGIWRPVILFEKLKKVKDNEYLLYLDAGCKLNKKGMNKFNEYIEKLDKSKYGIMSIQMTGNNGPGSFEMEKWWTTKEIFNYFNVDINSDIANTGQYLDGILLMKKNKHLIKIIELWLDAVLKNPLMFTDIYNNKQDKFFKSNRHEQSVFSLIRKIHGSYVIDGDESWMHPFGKGESLKYPFWAIRSKI